MKHSRVCTDLVRSFEGCVLSAYKDQGGIWTIGIGHTGSEVHEGLVWTQEQADSQFESDLTERGDKPVIHAIYPLVVAGMPQNEWDALVSLCFNIGGGNFASSTVVKEMNAGRLVEASAAILMWNKVKGVVNPGLQRRRLAEQKLFDTVEPL